jgi:hypothetical protein
MPQKKPAVHIRLPLRAEAGPEPQLGDSSPVVSPMPDPRTVSQEPVLKKK